MALQYIEFTWAQARAKRDRLIRIVVWEYQRNAREIRLSLTPTRDATWMDDLDDYVQELAEIPQTYEDPEDIVWPTMPT
ncbi:phage tail assembly chaperone [Thermodesulfobacteriota bacterium]